MQGTPQHDEERIARLRERRRTLAAAIRSHLDQIEKLEDEFEAAKRELVKATSGRQSPPAA